MCAQFYDKFQHRESVMEVMEYVWTIPAHKARFVEVLSDTVRAFAGSAAAGCLAYNIP